MTRLATLMSNDRYGDELALALFDLALAERVNPPTEADLAAWETLRKEDAKGLRTLFGTEDIYLQVPGVFYHGTSGDWAGLPLPTPDRPTDHHQGWPTALFVSPYFDHALRLGGFSQTPGATRMDARVYVGGLDDERIHQPIRSIRRKFDYPGAIAITNEQIQKLGGRFDPPGGLAAIEPPYYEDFEEDEGQVLILNPFAPRWFDIVLLDDLSTRGVRELGQQQGYEHIAQLDRQATLAAERMLDRTPLEELRARRWADDRREVADVIRETRFPAITGSIDPHADLGFASPTATQLGLPERWTRFLDETIRRARSADPSERERAARQVANVKQYLNWLANEEQDPFPSRKRAMDAVGWEFPGGPEDLRGQDIAKAIWKLRVLVGDTPAKYGLLVGMRLAYEATPPERRHASGFISDERQSAWAEEVPKHPRWIAYLAAISPPPEAARTATDVARERATRLMMKWLTDPLHGPTNPEVRQVIDHWGWDKVWDSPDQYTPEEMADFLDKFKRGTRPPGMNQRLYMSIARHLRLNPRTHLQTAR